MKLNNKGFVASTLMYSLLILFLFLILGLIALLSNRKMILDKLKNDIKEEVNSTKKYTYYENGTPIYFNPVTNKICSDYTEENSQTGVTEGCLKFYIFNDDINKASINMILDHNTSGNVAWNSSGKNSDGMNEVKDRLEEDTNKWNKNLNPRLIKADEVAHIVGADSEDTIKWKQSKNVWGTDNNDNKISWFYLDGSGTTYSQWQTQVANSSNKSKYAWLYDNTANCVSYGCNVEDNNNYPYGTKDSNSTASIQGYWTSDVHNCDIRGSFTVNHYGRLDGDWIDFVNHSGVRPVITVDKKEFKKSFVTTYDYTGDVQTFVAPVSGNYKIELWGAQGGYSLCNGSVCSTGGNGGKGAYVSGIINLNNNENFYVYVGGKGADAVISKDSSGGYNGGGIGSWDTKDDEASGAGGGATDIRITNGSWNNNISLNSRIMVAAGGGGASWFGNGGAGGELTGLVAESLANVPTQTTGYSFGMGQDATSFPDVQGDGNDGIAGGGGGYYGGYGSQYVVSGSKWESGSSGSSYISGHTGCVAITSSTSTVAKSGCTNETTNIECSYHYSGKKFTNTTMLNGNKSMPTHDGNSNMTGNAGNGYAKITYLGN